MKMEAHEAQLIKELLQHILRADGYTEDASSLTPDRKAIMGAFRVATKLVVEANTSMEKARFGA